MLIYTWFQLDSKSNNPDPDPDPDPDSDWNDFIVIWLRSEFR